MMPQKNQAGFTAIELLITLIIASMFLFAGYQLYIQVTRDGADANKTATLSNLVYERLRLESAATTDAPIAAAGCTVASQRAAGTVSNPAKSNVAGIGTVTFTVEVICPSIASGTLDIFHVKVKGTGGGKTIEHAAYVN